MPCNDLNCQKYVDSDCAESLVVFYFKSCLPAKNFKMFNVYSDSMCAV